MRLAGRLGLALPALLALSACAEQRPPINRVQPNVVEKAVFDGEWYFRQTVIDTPYSAGYTFVGEQGELHKIRWEVQEQLLIARRSYEHIAGSEGEGISGPTSETGAPVAVYRIESHFDIRREYNPVTGEELNVVVENTSDRAWYDRRFMRVDWSQNLVSNSDFMVLAKIFDGIQTEPVAFYVNDPTDPNAPRFERDADGSGISYVDIVNKMLVRPTSVHVDGLGDVPSCFLLYQNHLDCAPGEITVRNSFLRVDSARDYQPTLYTGDRMERFGYFVTERPGYDPEYGVVEPARLRFANRHNLWQQSHRRDAAGQLVTCTRDADCDDGRGSVCDLALARSERQTAGACTLPYRDRTVRPIAYHLSANFPEELEPDAQHLASEWNGAFVDTVASLRENECREHGGDAASCAGERAREDARTSFVVCHNPVRDDDHAACGARGTSARIGDLRYSMIGWVNEPHLSSPLGYGPSAADPETGEIIQGNAFVYGAGLETLASFARDIVALLNRDLSISDVTSGQNVERWVERTTSPGSLATGQSADDHVVPLDGDDAERVAAAMDFSWAHAHDGAGAASAAERPQDLRTLLDRMQQVRERIRRQGGYGSGEGRSDARLRALRDTPLESLLTGTEMRLAAGLDPRLPETDATFDAASPLRGMSLRNLEALDRARARIAAATCVVGAEFADEGMLGLARAIAAAVRDGDGTMEWYGHRYELVGDDGQLDYQAVRAMLRHPIFDAVTAHEVGHTLGLRHNFSGSYDALNYQPRYWQLRDDGDMAPRAWDPPSEAEVAGRIREAQYSTVMDYGNNFVVTDAEGIGHYDRAAIKMGYGDLVEVFTRAADPGAIAWIGTANRIGWPVPLRLESLTGRGELAAYAYTDYPALAGGREGLEARADVAYSSLRPDSFLGSQGLDEPAVDTQGRPAVPYLFCSDEQADLGPDCLRYDAGADAYETLQSVIDTYWSYYIFNSFRRERLGFSVGPYADRILTRYFAKLRNANQIYALYRSVFGEIFGNDASFERFLTRPDGMGAWTLGVGAGYQLLTRVITAPEPGSYGTTERADGTRALTSGASALFGELRIDALEGRYLETTWNLDDGYFWFDQLERAGFYYDKVLALEVLVDPETHFIGRDTAADLRRYQLSYYTTFGPSLTGFLGGVLADDWGAVAPRHVGDGRLTYPDPLALAQGDMPGVPVEPNASFSIQLFAAVYGMALVPETFDRTYFDRARIFVRGGAEGVELDPETPVVEFTDPRTGLTYVAASSHDRSGREVGVGARMLLHAQALADRGATEELARFVDNLDVVRQLSWRLAFGG